MYRQPGAISVPKPVAPVSKDCVFMIWLMLVAVLARFLFHLRQKPGDVGPDFFVGEPRGNVLRTIPVVGLDGEGDQSLDLPFVLRIA